MTDDDDEKARREIDAELIARRAWFESAFDHSACEIIGVHLRHAMGFASSPATHTMHYALHCGEAVQRARHYVPTLLPEGVVRDRAAALCIAVRNACAEVFDVADKQTRTDRKNFENMLAYRDGKLAGLEAKVEDMARAVDDMRARVMTASPRS